MSIPKYNDLLRPILALAAKQNITRRMASVLMADELSLTEEERVLPLPSGTSTYINNRTGWAMTYLTKARLIEKVAKATYSATNLGREFLARYPNEITTKDLETIDGYLEAWEKKKNTKNINVHADRDADATKNFTPEDMLEEGMLALNESLKSSLMRQLLEVDPYYFEQIVIDVLLAMGYGGSRIEAGKVTRKSNDGGIDGIINEDKLGLDVIYVQAKRYQPNVNINDVRNFVGSLAGKQAHKGIFITTSDYIQSAIEYVETVPQKIILINGSRLADLMIENNVGVTSERAYVVKKLDEDYFEQ